MRLQGKKAVARAQAGQYDRQATRARIDDAIAGSAVVVFSWSGCPFCKKAKALLDELGTSYTALELDTMPDGRALRAELAEARCAVGDLLLLCCPCQRTASKDAPITF